jgi:hypothetical protein
MLGLAAAVALAVAAPARAQDADVEATSWDLAGLRSDFCVQLLLDPADEALARLPAGYHPVPASAVRDLHVSLRSVIEDQQEFGAWSPSRLCFTTVDTVQSKDFTLLDKSGKRPQLFAIWSVLATGPAGTPEDVALDLFSNSDRLIRSARHAGQKVHEASLTVGKVPIEDENGVPSSDDRFQVKLRKTTLIWDGRLALDSTAVTAPVETRWATMGVRTAVATGAMILSPTYAQPMAGSLKVDGKDALSKALKASPTRFAGPSYRGGAGKVTLHR